MQQSSGTHYKWYSLSVYVSMSTQVFLGVPGELVARLISLDIKCVSFKQAQKRCVLIHSVKC